MILAVAMLCAPGGPGWEMDCRRCQHPQQGRELRARWGCDAPTTEPLLQLKPCPFCRDGEDSCATCKGTDQMPVHRCPNAIVTMNELEVARAALLVEQAGVLPDAGGWRDQAATFVAAWPHLQREIRLQEAEALKAAQKRAQQNQR